MKKYILTLIIILGAGAIWFGWQNKAAAPVSELGGQEQEATTTPVALEEKPVQDLVGKDLAWQTFQNYLAANKNHDIAKVKSLVYKMSPVCENKASTTECFARMDAAYEFGTKMKRFDMVNFREDNKQAILSSEPKLVDTKDSIGYAREIIYFVKSPSSAEASGQLKILRFYPSKGIFLPKEGAIDLESIRIAAENAVADEDFDGLEDSKDSNTNDRDMDKNGYWDGIDAQMLVQ
jgi:hypothetical protein